MPVLVPRDQPKAIGVDLGKIQKIREKLRQADINMDGSYNKEELKIALKDLGAIIPSWRASRCLGKADFDNDGQISGQEIDILIDYLLDRGFGK
ncbi:uncharacterized protein LOC113848323 [Abrus precatorius]|uniref:Uncharacterized protein LOC113848323 n=1 Tax=Abrus precatorius TaxID=3816 RepID=A0A8B8JQ51_ABRPR|nr:uncharacterized protein LOC113848323 [Abrus precatorius]